MIGLGNNNIIRITLGTQNVLSAYQGVDLVYTSYGPTQTFVFIDGVYTIVEKDIPYSEQGYNLLYSANIFNSTDGQSSSDFEIQNSLPSEKSRIYTYCDEQVNVYIDDVKTVVYKGKTFEQQGYNNMYTESVFDGNYESINDYQVQDQYPVSNNTYFTHCNDVNSYITMENVHGDFVQSDVVKDSYYVYQSNSSHNKDNEYDLVKITFRGYPQFRLLYGSYAESSYDFLVISNLDDESVANWNNSNFNRYLLSTEGKQSSDAPNLEYTFKNDGNEHFFYAMYRKDGSVNNDADRGYIAFTDEIGTSKVNIINDNPDYLTILHDASSDGNTPVVVSFNNMVENKPDIQYSVWKDGVMTQDWLQWDGSKLNITDLTGAIKFKGINPNGFREEEMKIYFKITGPARVQGNIMSLIDGKKTGTKIINNSYCFAGLFSDNSIISVSENLLPATEITDWAYFSLFGRCTALTNTPILPATKLGRYCYYSMFSSCTALTTAPALPATTLADYCYYSMFSGCTSLTEGPALPATTLRLGCYSGMFSDCTALTTAPALPATELAYSCYYYMFHGCTALATAPALPATTLAEDCYYDMFSGCTSLTKAPDLPATTLLKNSYRYMFKDCTNLNYIKCLATDISAQWGLLDFTKNVSPTGTFIKYADTNWPSGTSGIPEGWTVEDDDGLFSNYIKIKEGKIYNSTIGYYIGDIDIRNITIETFYRINNAQNCECGFGNGGASDGSIDAYYSSDRRTINILCGYYIDDVWYNYTIGDTVWLKMSRGGYSIGKEYQVAEKVTELYEYSCYNSSSYKIGAGNYTSTNNFDMDVYFFRVYLGDQLIYDFRPNKEQGTLVDIINNTEKFNIDYGEVTFNEA